MLVDAGMAERRGERMYTYIKDLLEGRRPWPDYGSDVLRSKTDVPYARYELARWLDDMRPSLFDSPEKARFALQWELDAGRLADTPDVQATLEALRKLSI